MPIPVTCPACKKQFTVPDVYAGKTGKCTKCQAPLAVPAMAAVGAPNPNFAASGDQLETFAATPHGSNPNATVPAAMTPGPTVQPQPTAHATGASSFKIGDVLGGYKLLKKLGDAKSSVFLAQSQAGAQVALKVLPPLGQGDRAQTAAKRVLREARSLFGLDVPNVVKVLDAGEELGCLYLAMDYFEGKTVREIMAAKGKLPEAEALAIAAKVARGLGALAEKNLVHRNVKPEHILVSPAGYVVLVGLGLVKATEEEDDAKDNLTMKGHVVGTPQYMSPEQAMGSPVDARGDLFSLGITLYEMLAGTVPWLDKTPMRTISLLTNADPPSLQEKNPAVSPFTVQVVGKLLEKSPGERYQTADELLAAIAPLTGEAAPAPKAKTAPVGKAPGKSSADAVAQPAGGSDALVKKLLLAVGLLAVAVLALGVLMTVLLVNK